MNTPLRAADYDRAVSSLLQAGMAQEQLDLILPLVRHNHYYHLLPDNDTSLWSQWGGTPSLIEDEIPSDFHFLCQIALNEIPEGPTRTQLPQEGFLYVAVHKRGRDKAFLLYKDKAPDNPAYDGTPIVFAPRTEVIFPEYESDAFDALDMPADAGNIYMDWEEEYMGDSYTRFAEGCRLLGGWTDDAQEITRSLHPSKQESHTIFLTLDPHENKRVKNSALGRIPLLAQKLYVLLAHESLANQDWSAPVCRYGKAPKR